MSAKFGSVSAPRCSSVFARAGEVTFDLRCFLRVLLAVGDANDNVFIRGKVRFELDVDDELGVVETFDVAEDRDCFACRRRGVAGDFGLRTVGAFDAARNDDERVDDDALRTGDDGTA